MAVLVLNQGTARNEAGNGRIAKFVADARDYMARRSVYRQTLREVEADGCRVVGWIGNRIDPDFATADASIDLLRRHLSVPCLGVIEHAADGAPQAKLDLGPLASAG